eukprot:CAMPEP_0202339008 /NCGR_PEP_ID=MMETSP1126-20121109/1053_1 /ASSEMBLY_ACC=CAM_ASM_000457 /TAXON_ID=3047 /ORGANISM="Dunaliella tertiolecta, Strain CCMP1320" /LENGTH=399 /DNA_ID=CAMNT_0048929495 /DNA_START=75 /DNA_END=1274 /DNA_ORIENTATION=+
MPGWSASRFCKLCKWIVLASTTAASDSRRVEFEASKPRPLLIVFGDSLSDQGNVYDLTNQTEPHHRLYFQGRFTNALCWVDYLDHNVEGKAWEGAQWDVINYAYGGSTACGPSALYVGTPPLAAQVRTYIQGQLPLKDKSLPPSVEATGTAGRVADIVIMAGGNDYIAKIIAATKSVVDNSKTMEEVHENIKNALRLLPEQVVGCILEELREILKVTKGGYSRRGGSPIPSHTVRSISIASLPALEDTPLFRTMLMGSAGALEALSKAESRHTQLLREGLQDLSAQDYPLLSLLDVNSLTQEFYSKAGELGIVNVDDACLQREARGSSGADTTPCQSDASEVPLRLNPSTPPPPAQLRGEFQGCCANPGQYFFYDNVHPSSTIHFHAARYIRAFLEGII